MGRIIAKGDPGLVYVPIRGSGFTANENCETLSSKNCTVILFKGVEHLLSTFVSILM